MCLIRLRMLLFVRMGGLVTTKTRTFRLLSSNESESVAPQTNNSTPRHRLDVNCRSENFFLDARGDGCLVDVGKLMKC